MTDVATAYSQKDLDRIRRVRDLFDAGDVPNASAAVEEYLRDNPNDAQGLAVAAMILKKSGRLPFAYSIAKQSVEAAPWHPEPYCVLGLMAQNLWRLDEAMDAYRKALQRAKTPKQRALYLNNVASIHLDNGDFTKAEPFIKESLDLEPDDRMARHNYGLCLFARHEWTEGWKYYSSSIGSENRLNIKYTGEPGEPKWDGTKGKTVVIYGEQGLGDEIVAASMLPNAIDDCGKVIVDCDKRLEGLFKRSFPKATVHGTRWEKGLAWPEEDQAIDYSIAGFEIGQFYRKSDADFPTGKYLTPCPDRTEMWRALFRKTGKPAIGVAWTGGTWQNASKYRCYDIKQWQPIFDSFDAHWVSLQYKDASKEIAGTPVVQYPWGTLTKDYDDTAAMVAALDCVISVPTAVVHLAGALGTPTIAMMASKPCWKFAGGLQWHPNVKLIPNNGDWAKTVKDTAASIRQFLTDSKR